MKHPVLVSEALALRRLPVVKIEMSGGEGCRGQYEAFTRRHARWRVIQNKAWGVALIRIPDHADDYRLVTSKTVRNRVSHAAKVGFSCGPLDSLGRLDQILAINRSADQRQGMAMHADYLDEQKVRHYFEYGRDAFGVNDPSGVLRAYASVATCGDVAYIERFLGHADSLKDGVMYLLMKGMIEEMISRRQMTGRPSWFMYDMFSGASPGMRTFKHAIGCRPYRVSWIWRE